MRRRPGRAVYRLERSIPFVTRSRLENLPRNISARCETRRL